MSFRNLTNYKSLHANTVKQKGVEKQFQNAQTLTQARKILFGIKKGNAGLKK